MKNALSFQKSKSKSVLRNKDIHDFESMMTGSFLVIKEGGSYKVFTRDKEYSIDDDYVDYYYIRKNNRPVQIVFYKDDLSEPLKKIKLN